MHKLPVHEPETLRHIGRCACVHKRDLQKKASRIMNAAVLVELPLSSPQSHILLVHFPLLAPEPLEHPELDTERNRPTATMKKG